MLAEIGWFQAILDFFGAVLAAIYDLVGNYGLAIVIFTVIIRIMIIPLGVKQVKSMYAMQQLAPQMKKLRNKYKNDRQKLNEEMMKMYRENGVNPMGGCLPILLQAPVFFALYAVLTSPFPGRDNHIPPESELYQQVIVTQDGVDFLGMNLLCTPAQAGDPSVQVRAPQIDDTPAVEASEDKTASLETLDCGNGPLAKVPYIILLVAMVAMTYFQNAQMMKMNPNAATTPKVQQNIMKVMPLIFGVVGFQFQAGLIVYWVTSASWQVLQSRLLLQQVHRKLQTQKPIKPIVEDDDEDDEAPRKKGGAQGGQKGGGQGQKGGPKKGPQKSGQKGGPQKAGGQKGKPASGSANKKKPEPPRKKGFLERMAEQAEAERARRQKGKD